MADLESYLPTKSRFRYAWEEFVKECLTEMYIKVHRNNFSSMPDVPTEGGWRGIPQWWDSEGESDMREAIWLVLERRLHSG